MLSKISLTTLLFLSLNSVFGQADIEKKIQTQLILAKDGSTVEITEGSFTMTKSLSLEGKKNITIRGKGMDKTILSFKNQTSGAEGIRISECENIILEDLTVQDSKGDLIKTMHVKGITFRRVKAEWTGKPSATNGGYAFYPVQCENVLIDPRKYPRHLHHEPRNHQSKRFHIEQGRRRNHRSLPKVYPSILL